MKVAFFSAKSYDRDFFDRLNASFGHELHYFEVRLTSETAPLAAEFAAVCVFVNDELNAATLKILAAGGTKLIALRCAGFNQVNLDAARELGMQVVRVPAYSPHAVAEHTLGLMLTLNRKFHRAHARVREGNFALDGLMGFDMHGKTVGVIGTGKIGQVMAMILLGLGCRVLAHDPQQDEKLIAAGVDYVELDALWKQSDIITLHCPLVSATHHLINEKTLRQMKHGVMINNTGRGSLIDTKAAIAGLKQGQIGCLGLDVYEEEADLFFEDRSESVLQDDIFARLLTFPNVLITGHQAFFTREAVENIVNTTLENITMVEHGETCPNEVATGRG